MIRLLNGQVQLVALESVVIDVQGVGYELFLPVSLLRSLVSQGEKAKRQFHVYTHVREDALELYGFSTAADRNLFVQLLSVSGVGPKSALAVLDKGAASIVEAVQNSDVAFFKSVPRLGKKTAQKIILELQSKLGSLAELNLAPESEIKRDVREALLSMGYASTDVEQILSQLDQGLKLEEALKWALQNIGKK